MCPFSLTLSPPSCACEQHLACVEQQASVLSSACCRMNASKASAVCMAQPQGGGVLLVCRFPMSHNATCFSQSDKRATGPFSVLRWWPREGVHWWLQVRSAVWYASVGAATVLVGIPLLRAANRLKLQRHTFISQTYATTPPLTSSTHSSQLSPLLRSLQMAFRRVLGAPALGAAARCAVTTTPRAWQSKVRCVSLPSPASISTMNGVS